MGMCICYFEYSVISSLQNSHMSADSAIQKVKARDRTYQPAMGFLYAGKDHFQPITYRQGKKYFLSV